MAKRAMKGSARSDYGPIPSASALETAGSEMKANPPSILAKTRKKFGVERALAQERAILFSKARKGK